MARSHYKYLILFLLIITIGHQGCSNVLDGMDSQSTLSSSNDQDSDDTLNQRPPEDQQPPDEQMPPVHPPSDPFNQVEGWTDITEKHLVESDGRFSLGDNRVALNPTRDQGSKILYIDSVEGDNSSGEPYWYKDGNIVDSTGSPTNSLGLAYGTNPLRPNELAIKPLRSLDITDSRVQTNNPSRSEKLAGGFPDWFLFKRGHTHSGFSLPFSGGRSREEPMVVSSYGETSLPRPILVSDGTKSPFDHHNRGADQSWMHLLVKSVEIKKMRVNYLGYHEADSFAGGPTTSWFEDVYFNGSTLVQPPTDTVVRRSVISHVFRIGNGHVQGFFTSGFKQKVIFDETIFYKNGFKSDPRVNVDPVYDKFSRNVYQGGGAQMGFKYLNVSSIDGGSGGPQMRLGGLMQNSLIVEGYFFSGTSSNGKPNPWAEADAGQTGQTAVVKNNVQLIYGYPTPMDPDLTGESDTVAHPRDGYSLNGGSYGAEVSGNIISGALLEDNLLQSARQGIAVMAGKTPTPSGIDSFQKNNVIENNIAYRVSRGLAVGGSHVGDSSGILIRNNIIVSNVTPLRLSSAVDVPGLAKVSVEGNQFFTNQAFDSRAPSNWSLGETKPYEDAVGAGKLFSDPDRTIKRYLEEVLEVQLLDWDDDPYLDPMQKAEAKGNGEVYDPAGLKTFGTLQIRMRQDGTEAIVPGEKPRFDADLAWDERLTGKAVVNWIREGFDRPPVP